MGARVQSGGEATLHTQKHGKTDVRPPPRIAKRAGGYDIRLRQYHPNQEVEQPPGALSQARASPGPGPGEVFLQGKETETLHNTVICTHKECK